MATGLVSAVLGGSKVTLAQSWGEWIESLVYQGEISAFGDGGPASRQCPYRY